MPFPRTIPALVALLVAASALASLRPSQAEDRSSRAADSHDLAMSATIDDQVARAGKTNGLTPSPLADDAEFLRRVTLDLNGVIPSPDEVVAFLKDPAPDKRRRKIDELLERDAYADHFGIVWLQILLGGQRLERVKIFGEARPWLTDAFRKNLPYDKLVKQLVTAEGVSDEDGSVAFMLRFDQQTAAMDAASVVTKLFLGVQIQCAQCHNHPYEKWSKDQFHNVAAFFTRLRNIPIRGENGKRQAFAVKEELRGRYTMPDTEPPRQMEPVFLDGTRGDDSPGANLRAQYARWMTTPDNPWFARMLVNRYWAMFLGRGLVDPIDDFGESNPPTHPELLDGLAADFVAHGYDLKYLCRVIANSKTYQLSSRINESNAEDRKYYSHARLRPLSPEQLLNSLAIASGIAERGVGLDPERAEKLRDAILLRFNFVFGNDEGGDEVSFEGTIPQALLMLNGKLTNDAVRATSKTTVARVMDEVDQPALRVERLFLTALGRYPTAEETKSFVAFVQQNAGAPAPEGNAAPFQGLNDLGRGKPGQGDGGKRPKGRAAAAVAGSVPYEDVLWALLNATEFRFNH